MSIPVWIRTYLNNRDCDFTGRKVSALGSFLENLAAAHIPAEKVARSQIVVNGHARLMVVYPANRNLDFDALEKLLTRRFEPCPEDDLSEVVPGCDPEALPPLGELFGLSVILDRALVGLDKIYFSPGVPDLFVSMSGSEFIRLHAHSLRKLEISRPLPEENDIVMEEDDDGSPALVDILAADIQAHESAEISLPKPGKKASPGVTSIDSAQPKTAKTKKAPEPEPEPDEELVPILDEPLPILESVELEMPEETEPVMVEEPESVEAIVSEMRESFDEDEDYSISDEMSHGDDANPSSSEFDEIDSLQLQFEETASAVIASLEELEQQSRATDPAPSASSKPRMKDPRQAAREAARAQLLALRKRIRNKVESTTQLPAMPGIATEIISMRNNAFSTPVEVAAVIEQDPALSAQLIRYATSPLYGYQGKVDSVEKAIVRVLGLDFVFNLALGLSLGRKFKNPKEGPIGLDSFWQHAVRAGTLAQSLCNYIPIEHRPAPGVAYLAGLLHNFGFLLLGHLFPYEFRQLNKIIGKYPQRSVVELEQRSLGVTHCELGKWLMRAWKMPVEIQAVVEHHHNLEYGEQHASYVRVVQIANALLKRQGIGDAASSEIKPILYKRAYLAEDKAEAALQVILDAEEGLDFIARKMVA